jgi:hypothetical protein
VSSFAPLRPEKALALYKTLGIVSLAELENGHLAA